MKEHKPSFKITEMEKNWSLLFHYNGNLESTLFYKFPAVIQLSSDMTSERQ
jgi:hypothetical protein